MSGTKTTSEKDQFRRECRRLHVPAKDRHQVYVDDESIGSIDVVISHNDLLIAVEFGCTPGCIANLVTKAKAIHADELWIVANNSKVRDQIRHQLLGLHPFGIYLQCLSEAIERLNRCFRMV